MAAFRVIDGGHRASLFGSAVALVTAAVLVAGCGGSDDGGESETVAQPTVDVSTSEPSTTASTTTTASTPSSASTTSTTSTSTTATSTTGPTTIAASTTDFPAATTTASAATTAPPVVPEYCAAAGPLPAGAVLDSSLTLDVVGDGTADDVIEAWDVDGRSRLRLTTGGSIVSEIINTAVDGRYRPLGTASVLSGGSPELFAVVGEGSAATEVGLFGVDSAECLFGYTYASTDDEFTMLIRPASSFRSGAICFDGGIDLFNAEQRSDGTWEASSAAYELAGPFSLQYIAASDGYVEGLDESDLGSFGFDCFGLSL